MARALHAVLRLFPARDLTEHTAAMRHISGAWNADALLEGCIEMLVPDPYAAATSAQ